MFFFFQAEDGIRDVAVTGVQTCALPISQVQPGNCAAVQSGCRKGAGADQPVQDRGSVTCSSRSGRSAVDYHVPSHWRLERAPGVAAEPRLFHFVELLSLLSPASELPALSARWTVCSRALCRACLAAAANLSALVPAAGSSRSQLRHAAVLASSHRARGALAVVRPGGTVCADFCLQAADREPADYLRVLRVARADFDCYPLALSFGSGGAS